MASKYMFKWRHFFGLPCHIRKVVCDVSEEPTASVIRLTERVEEDDEEIGREERVDIQEGIL
jgi:hypothetical protein